MSWYYKVCWDRQSLMAGGVVYDNQPGAGEDADPTDAIEGGSIVLSATVLQQTRGSSVLKPLGLSLHDVCSSVIDDYIISLGSAASFQALPSLTSSFVGTITLFLTVPVTRTVLPMFASNPADWAPSV